jgi:hypothetical protein
VGERLGLLAVAVEALEDATERGALDDECADAHCGAAEGTQQRVDLVDLADVRSAERDKSLRAAEPMRWSTGSMESGQKLGICEPLIQAQTPSTGLSSGA